MSIIDAQQLKDVCQNMSIGRAQQMADLINKLFPEYGITTHDVMHEALANFLQESLEFNYKVENMYYGAETLVKTWPSRFKTIEAAKPYAKNPKALANFVYNGRMGNIPGTDDGFNFRGSGFVGLTGRNVLKSFANYKKLPMAEDAANYARSSDYGALDSALWFFCIYKNLKQKAQDDDMIGIVKEINGGLIGLKDRLFYYERLKKIILN